MKVLLFLLTLSMAHSNKQALHDKGFKIFEFQKLNFLVYHDTVYREPDEHQKAMIATVRNNIKDCRMVYEESQCLQWLFGSDYFWA